MQTKHTVTDCIHQIGPKGEHSIRQCLTHMLNIHLPCWALC